MQAERLRLLVIEDRAEDAELIERTLRRSGFEATVQRVHDERGLVSALHSPWDLVLSDYNLPSFNALRALELVRAAAPDTPFVVVTGSVSEEVAVECMKRGASDYLLKDRLTRLPQALQQVIRAARARQDSRVAAERLRAKEEELHRARRLEAIGRLAAGVAHDFNNLLGVIQGSAELLAQDLPVTHPALPRVQAILSASERAAGLTRQLLALGRRQPLELETLDVCAALRSAARDFEPMLGSGVCLNLDLAGENCRVKVDRHQFGQVLQNLVLNARDAMPEGGEIGIGLRVVRASFGGGQEVEAVEICVRDQGVGMDPATLERCFEPFFTTKAPSKGTGLGLATTYSIVEQSGGRIEVESQLGVGTRFRVLLPAAP